MKIFIVTLYFLAHLSAFFVHCQSKMGMIYARVFIETVEGYASEVVDITHCFVVPQINGSGFIGIENIYPILGCVNIYKGQNCKGDYIVIESGDRREHIDHWRDKTVTVGSIGPCDQECVGKIMEKRPNNMSSVVTFHNNDPHKALHPTVIDVKGCVNLQNAIAQYVKSIDFNDDICIELYENDNCQGKSVRRRKDKRSRTTIERLSWTSNRGRSVSLCAHNCSPPKNETTEHRKLVPPHNIATLYSHRQPTQVKQLDMSQECMEMKNLKWWAESRTSFLIYQQCLIMYSLFGCSNSTYGQHLILNQSNWSTVAHTRMTSFSVMSIKPCDLDQAVLYAKKSPLKGVQNDTMLLDVSKCMSSPRFGTQPATIANTEAYNDCLHLYQEENCRGRYIKRIPDNFFNLPLPTQNQINAIIGSIGPCSECIPRNIQEGSSNVSQTIKLYGSDKNLGNFASIDVSGCHIIPRKLNRRVKSIKHDGSLCIELHEHSDCSGRSVQHGAGAGSRQLITVEEFETPADNVLEWTGPLRSVSFCEYNCNRPTKTNHSNISSPGPGIVTIFDEPHFTGNFKHLNLKTGCINILDEWEGELKSISAYGICIKVHSLHGCNYSDQSSQFNDSDEDSQGFYFNWKIRSIESCDGLPEVTDKTVLIAALAPSLAVFGLAVVAAVICVHLRRRNILQLSSKDIQEFLNGTSYPDPKDHEYSPGWSQPYDKKFEVPRHFLTVDINSLLGFGEFAVVYKGTVWKELDHCYQLSEIAVKTVKPHSRVKYTRALLKDIKTMIYVGHHPRIVQLVGCCTENLLNGELYVMTGLCMNGTLEKFLRTKNDCFVNLIDNDQTVLDKLQVSSQGAAEVPSSSYFNTNHLMQWSIQIAEGMEYLTYKRVIHGDLATRNVLLAMDFNIRISDFGLSRQLYQYSQYNKTTASLLPWRWFALETLKTLTFSTESDVWAFGVTLWEIFSLGDTPFSEETWNEDFVNSLIDGHRLSKPKCAPSYWWNLILECWNERSSDRITFRDLRTMFGEFRFKYGRMIGGV